MGHEDEGRAPVALECEEQIHDLAARGFVEIAGRLVGNENCRVRSDGTSDGDTLLLSPGELGRIMMETVSEADRFELGLGSLMCVGLVGEFEGKGDVLQGGHCRHQMEGLEHDSDAPPTKPRQGILVERPEIGALHMDASRFRALQAGHHHKKRRLAGARGADQPYSLAARYFEGDAAQDMHTGRPPAKTEIDLRKGDRRALDLAGYQGRTDLCEIIVMNTIGQGFARMGLCHTSRIGVDMVGRRAPCQHSRRTALAMTLFAALGAGTGIGHAASRPLNIVAFGDSLTAGYRLPSAAAFPSVLERELKARGREVSIANAGVSGDTSTGGLDRLDWSVPDGTDGVILELGANDMLRGTDPAVTKKALDTIVSRLKARNIPVLLAGMKASANLGPDYVARFDAIYPDLASRYGLVLYPFFLDGIVGDRRFNLEDGLHPNVKGVETIVAGILPTVETFLDKLGTASK